MQDSIEDLTRRIKKLEEENRALAARVGELEGEAPRHRDAAGTQLGGACAAPGVVSRRGLLRQMGAAAAVAGGAVAGMSVLGAKPAGAGTGPMLYGDANFAGGDETTLISASSQGTFLVASTDAGACDGALIVGVENSTNTGPAVKAYTMGSGCALHATSTLATSSAEVVRVGHAGLGRGVNAALTNGSNASAAVNASTKGSGPGVNASSTKGVGGRFSGKTAQIRLVAGASASPPVDGARGDLYVGSTGHLFFCKGASGWVTLA